MATQIGHECPSMISEVSQSPIHVNIVEGPVDAVGLDRLLMISNILPIDR
jgi:hypothetical protein